MRSILIQTEPLDIAREQAALQGDNPRVGALATFVGLMRDLNEGIAVSSMTLEHYPGMTEKALGAIADEAAARWALEGIRILHRVGALEPCDPIVFVGVASQHRGDAFRACEFLIDALKTRAPFWKKEHTVAGERWVDAHEADSAAAGRWSDPVQTPSADPSSAASDRRGRLYGDPSPDQASILAAPALRAVDREPSLRTGPRRDPINQAL